MAESNTNPIIINNLQKSYGAVRAVRGVSFEVQEGEIFGLIGPDGAGKTTIIRIVVSLLAADSGEVLFKGKSVGEHIQYVRTNVGYMPQRFSLYQDLTVRENLDFFGDLFKVPPDVQRQRREELYAFSKLGPFENRRAGQLSGGMKQKLALSCMLMHEPDVILLDEPTYGVDPVSRSEFWDILKKLAERGTTILVTTAYMDEAHLCDRVGLMFDGQLLALDTPSALLKQFEKPLFLVESSRPHETYTALKNADFKGEYNLFGNGVHISAGKDFGRNELIKLLEENRIEYKSIRPVQPGLEDLFLELQRKAGDKNELLNE